METVMTQQCEVHLLKEQPAAKETENVKHNGSSDEPGAFMDSQSVDVEVWFTLKLIPNGHVNNYFGFIIWQKAVKCYAFQRDKTSSQ